ncbi:MAG: hypothetical protein WBF97_07775 [Comamonas sp.]
MLKIRILLTIAFMMTTPLVLAADGDEALFGLKWGMTPADVKSAGVNLTKTKGDRNLEIFRASSVPRGLSDFESYHFIFADGKLVKLWGLSKDIVNYPAGITGKQQFDALRLALTEKYGKPKQNYQSTGNKLFKEYDEFYQCLAYSGCGIWVVGFEVPGKYISLELKGQRRGMGYLDITSEAQPQWDNALEVYKSRKAISDKDAL